MKKRYLHSDRNGTTLMELMITVAILGIVFTIGPNIFVNITRFSRLSSARIETQRAARDTLNQINQSLRQACASTIVISQETGQPPSSNISFSTIDSRNMKFFQYNKELRYVVNGGTRTLTDGLRFLAFSYPRTDAIDEPILSVSLTYEKETYEGGSKALQMAIEKVRIMNP